MISPADAYVFAGGGTGGHLYPALAIASELKKAEPGARICFIGTKGKIESKVVPQEGYEFRTLWISGLRRSLSPENLLVPVKAAVSMVQENVVTPLWLPAASCAFTPNVWAPWARPV